MISFSLEGGGGGQADLREGGGDQNGGGRDSSAQGWYLQPQGASYIFRNLHVWSCYELTSLN